MLSNLKYFLKHSLVYSVSNAASKAIGVVLLPLYTKFITLAEFGVLGILEVTISIFTEVINLGLGPALVMLSNLKEHSEKRRSVLFTIASMSILISLSFVIISQLAIPYIASMFGDPKLFEVYFRFSSVIVALRVLNNIFNDKLRADEKSVVYTILNLSKITLTLALTIYFVAFAKLGVLGVLYSYTISESVIFIIVLSYMATLMQFKFDREVGSIAVKFGFPLIFGSVAMLVLNVSDRYILKFFANYATLGLYDLGYRLAGVLNMFFIMPLSMTLMPIAYKIYNKEGDKRYFSKLMTYFTFVIVWAGLALSLFSQEIIKIFALNPSYWPAYQVVPVIVFSYIFFGMRLISNLGMFLTKNTKYVALITIIAAAINVILNFIFIPKYGMMAAAFTTLVSFIVLYILSDYFSSKYYKIPFENKKLIGVISLGVVLYLVSMLYTGGEVISIVIKLSLLATLPFILYLFNFYEPVELERLAGFYTKWKNPGSWKENIREIIKQKNLNFPEN